MIYSAVEALKIFVWRIITVFFILRVSSCRTWMPVNVSTWVIQRCFKFSQTQKGPVEAHLSSVTLFHSQTITHILSRWWTNHANKKSNSPKPSSIKPPGTHSQAQRKSKAPSSQSRAKCYPQCNSTDSSSVWLRCVDAGWETMTRSVYFLLTTDLFFEPPLRARCVCCVFFKRSSHSARKSEL